MTTSKLCECGCGQVAPIAQKDYPKFGHIKGQPMRFCRGHYLKLHPYRTPYERPPLTVRFWKHVDKSGECWIWTGAKTGNGYGAIRYKGKQEGAHRIAWILANGDIPEGLVVRHSCDNPLCVRLDHLSLGTIADNTADMICRNRTARCGPKTPACGERNAGAVLTEMDVKAIRQAYKDKLTVKILADRFNVTPTTIRNIVNGKTWKYLQEQGETA